MKHIIIILSSALLLTSCSKKPKCWECTKTVTSPQTSQTTAPVVTTFNACDKTKAEIKELENSMTIISTKPNTASVVTECH